MVRALRHIALPAFPCGHAADEMSDISTARGDIVSIRVARQRAGIRHAAAQFGAGWTSARLRRHPANAPSMRVSGLAPRRLALGRITPPEGGPECLKRTTN